jgi:hypothetical protein
MPKQTTYLSHVEDLEAVARSLGADIREAINDLHVTPETWLRLGGQAAQICQTTVL